jgi:hypothetical protein
LQPSSYGNINAARTFNNGKYHSFGQAGQLWQWIITGRLTGLDLEKDTVVSPGRRSGVATMVECKSQYLWVRRTTSLKSPSHDISQYLTAPSLTMTVYDYFGTRPNMLRQIQYNSDPVVNVPA